MLGKVALGVLAAALVLGPIPAGSQGDRARWLLAGACFLSAVLLAAYRLFRRRVPAADGLYWVFAAAGGLVLLGLIPFPRGLVSLLSPARAAWQGQVERACSLHPAGWLIFATCAACARDTLVLFLAWACAYFVASEYASRTDRTVVILGCIALAGAAVAVLGTADQFIHGGRLTATFTNANRLASLLALATGAAITLALIERRRRMLWLACATASQLGLFLTFSRMGIASAAAGAAAVILVRRKDIGRRRAVTAIAAAVLAVLALNAAVGLSPVLERYSMLFEPGALRGGRLACWRDSLFVYAEFPVTGSGAGSFKHVFAAYQDPSLAGWYKFAHSDPLNVLCDVGPLALAVAAGGVVFWYARALKAVRSGDERLKAIATGAIFGVTAVLVHSLADYPLRQPAVAVSFFVVAGLCSGAARRKLLPFSRGRTWTGWLAVAVSAAGFAACAWLCSAAVASSAGRFELASRMDPLSAEAPLFAARRLGLRLQGDERPADSLQEARALIERSLRRNPMDARAVYLAGALKLLAWDARGGDRAVDLASRLAPAWPDVGMKAGRYFLTRWVRTGKKNAWLRARAVDVLSRAARTPGGVQAVGRALSDAGALDGLWKEILPDAPGTLVFMGRDALLRGDHERAVPFLDEAERRGAEVGLELARAYFYGGRPRECAARLKALGVRKMDRSLLSRPEEGLKVCAALREAGEKSAALDALEGRLLLRLGDITHATGMLLRAAAELNDADVWADLARAELRQGLSSPASNHAARAVDLAPTRPDLRLLRGRILEKMRALPAAEREYRTAWLYAPRSFDPPRRLARLLRSRGDVFKALRVLEEAARREGAPAEAHFRLAVACEELARYDQALAEAGRARELKPTDERYAKLLRELEARVHGR